jgi:parvulin-like peptidyl-prolyl isomerase
VRRLVVPALCALLLTAACSSAGDEEVARVGDHVITVDDVSVLFETDSVPIDANFRLAAFRLIALDVLDDAIVADFGATVDEDAVDAAYQSFKAQVEESGSNIPDGYDVDTVLRLDARLTVMRDLVIDALVNAPAAVASMQEHLAEDPAAYTTVCVRHILTGDLDGIEAAKARLDAGEDFATVADEVSLDTSSVGGDLGCTAPGVYVDAVADAAMEAEVGTLYGPFQSEYGYHLLIVDERTTPTADELAADPLAYVDDDTAQALWIDWLDAKLAAVDIEVNAKFGVWDDATQRIVAPTEEG